MTSVRGRGRGMGSARGGGSGGGNERNGSDARRGSWRGGPPGSNNSLPNPRGGSPASANSPVAGKTSINDHMSVMGTVTDDKARTVSAKGFQTDTDISAGGRQGAHRELQPWAPDATNGNGANGVNKSGGGRDAETFGLEGNSKIPWDQFETNARLFGATTNYEEELYTTKLDRSSAGYKQREKEAARLASEIMGQAATNSHVAEERNQAAEGPGKDEEEKYSGVQRAPNAYVPPGARRSAGQGAVPGRAPAGPAATGSGLKENGSASLPAPQPIQSAKSSQLTETLSSTSKLSPSAGVQPPIRSTSDVPSGSERPADIKPTIVTPQSDASAPPNKEGKPEKPMPPASVVDQFRSFVGSEREKVEAKKQSMVKQERERTLADFKKFQSNFKVPLPMPKDILPLLAKDAEKQKAIEEKAAQALEDAKKKPEVSNAKPAPPPLQSRKISMKIPEIPPFKPKPPPAPPVLPIADTASKDIPLATSPTPSSSSHLSGNPAPRLNPNANSFVFKPNPAAAAFKPGQPSAVTSSPKTAAPLPSTPAAGPSAPKGQNPFFREQPPPMKGIDPRSDFNPWKQGPLPAASSISPQWPFTGRKYTAFMPVGPLPGGPMGFDDEQSPPLGIPPHLMAGLPPNYPAYAYRFQPGMPPQGVPNQMFSPGSQFQPLPSGPIPGQTHLGGPPPNGPIGVPLHFYQNGMHQNPQFIPPNLTFNPNARGPSGPPGHGNPMFFQQHQHQHTHSSPTPQHTPQVHQAALQHPPPPYSPIPPGQAQLSGANGFEKFEGNGGGGGGH